MKNKNSFRRAMQCIACIGSAVVLTACASGPKFAGVSAGYLKPCPSSPNCVGTFELDEQRVAPFTLAVSPDQAMADIARVLGGMSRVEIAVREDRYIRAEFSSAVFRFVDDVEFYAQDSGNLAIRSASRVGYSDLGANRRRVEELREVFRDNGIIR